MLFRSVSQSRYVSDYKFTSGKYINTSGSLINTANTLFNLSEAIYIENGDTLSYKLRGYNNVICVIASFKDGVFVSNSSVFYQAGTASGEALYFENTRVFDDSVDTIIIGYFGGDQNSITLTKLLKSDRLQKIEQDIETKINDAPNDGKQYLRESNSWTEFTPAQYVSELIDTTLNPETATHEKVASAKVVAINTNYTIITPEELNLGIGFKTWNGGYITPTGAIVQDNSVSPNYRYSPKFEIESDTEITIAQVFGNKYIASVAAYTSGDVFVQACSHIGSSILIPADPVVIDTTGYNISYIRITYGGGLGSYNVYVTQHNNSFIHIKDKISQIEQAMNNGWQMVS